MTDGNSIAFGRSFGFEREADALSSAKQITRFYEEAGTDFTHWSRELNIHLGLYRWGMNPFDRDAMFEEMNVAVADRLNLPTHGEPMLLDLGCGFGAISRTVARRYPNSKLKGVTLSPMQVKVASELNRDAGLADRMEILEEDFTNLPFEEALSDGAWAVESACYARGPDKVDLIREAARVLKPGGRFVIADCFAIRPVSDFGPLLKRCHSAACRNWAVPEMPTLQPFVDALKRNGFSNVIVEDVSWQAAPSVAHAPLAVITFISKKLLGGRRLNKASVDNLKASLLAVVIGASRRKFRYCLVSATRD